GVRVTARVEPEQVLPVLDLLRDRAPLFLTARDRTELADQLTPERIVATVERLARQLQEPDGAHLQRRAAIDPLGLTDRALRGVQGFGDAFRGARLQDGWIVSADGHHLLLRLELGFPPGDVERSAPVLADLLRNIAHIEADPACAGICFHCLSAHRSTLDNVEQIRRDVWVTSSVGLCGVVVLAALCFGRLALVLLALLPGLCGGLLALGALGATRGTVAGAVLGFGAVLLGLTIDFAIHVLFRLDRGASRRELPTRALWMGGTTTALAFVALLASSLPAVRDVGVFGAIGVTGAALCAVLVLPALVPPGRRSRPLLDLERLLARIRPPRRPMLLVALVATPVLGAGILWLHADGDPEHLAALAPATRTDQQQVFATWGRADRSTQLVVEGPTRAAVLEQNDRLAERLEALRRTGIVASHASLAGLLPAPSTQRRRIAAWRQMWSAERIAATERALAQATARTPFRDGAFAPFLAWLRTAPQTLSLDDPAAAPLRAFLGERAPSQQDGRWHLATPVTTAGPTQTAALIAELRATMPDVAALNARAFAGELSALVTGEVGLLGVCAFAMASAVVFLWLGHAVMTAVIVLPLLLSLVWTLGLLGWLRIPINLANAVFVVFLFGAAVDYAIFLAVSQLDRFRGDPDHTAETRAAVLLCALSTCFGFGSLALAGHPALHVIGITALLGIGSALTCTLLVVPSLTAAVLRRNGPNGTPSLRNLLGAGWVFGLMAGGGSLHLLGRVFTRRTDPAARRRATILRIAWLARQIRDRLPFGRRRYTDLEQLDAVAGPRILVANHESMYDIVAILALPLPIRILVKGWIWRMPLVGGMARAAGYVLAEGRDPEAIAAEVRDAVACGDSVLVFPEGRRSRDGTIGRFHNGAFALARQLGIPVQPVAMVNTRQGVPYRTWWIGDHDALVAVLPPVDPAPYAGEGADRRMAREVRDAVRARVRELWPQTWQGAEWPRIVGGMYRYLGPLLGHYAVSKCKRDPLVAELPGICSGDGPILVAGCGYGLMTARLALWYPERAITAVDCDAEKVCRARTALGEGQRVDWVTADLRTAELPAADVVLAVDVLHYWDEAGQRAILQRLVSAMRPGARLVFRDGCRGESGSGWVAALERFAIASRFTRGQRGLSFRSREGWVALLQECGLEVVEVRPDLGALANVVLIARRPRDPAAG
ncbi:MAG: 1-acyl-sn-glycerol-3-phosphate acyltransferase, partial [Planctomycetes bacterium]|nr:1-acyl-sn-glycerol-3-phosphate acyltransferase [Planctomycetota bacterium]